MLPTVGAAGVGFTVTVIVTCGLEHVPFEMVNEYVPEAAVVTPAMDGFCTPDEKLFGPVHAYVDAGELDVRFSVPPEHTGELLPSVGVAGTAFTVSVTGSRHQPPQLPT